MRVGGDNDDAAGDDMADDDASDGDLGDDDTMNDDDLTENNTSMDDDTNVDVDTVVVVDVDFDDCSFGGLPLPWTVDLCGSGTITVEKECLLDTGKLGHLVGGITGSDATIAGYVLTGIDYDVTVSFGFRYAMVTAGRFDLNRNDDSIEILSRLRSGNTLSAAAQNCAMLTPDTWQNVNIVIDYSAATDDVLLDCVSSSCIGLAFQVGGMPLDQLDLIDGFNGGPGGDEFFDNLPIEIIP